MPLPALAVTHQKCAGRESGCERDSYSAITKTCTENRHNSALIQNLVGDDPQTAASFHIALQSSVTPLTLTIWRRVSSWFWVKGCAFSLSKAKSPRVKRTPRVRRPNEKTRTEVRQMSAQIHPRYPCPMYFMLVSLPKTLSELPRLASASCQSGDRAEDKKTEPSQ